MQLILTKEIMSYKQAKKQNEILTKIRIIRFVLKNKYKKQDIAKKFNCHRNTISNLVNKFNNLDKLIKDKLLNNNLSCDQLIKYSEKLLDKPPIPKTNPFKASKEQEELIVKLFQKTRIGVNRMYIFLKRKYYHQENHILNNLTISKIRGIYKRNNLRIKKIKSKNNQRKALYDYKALACFERLHFDTKVIPDQKALPKEIYDKFIKKKKEIPKYMWNIIDAKSRARFIAYSYSLSAEFGLRFLILVIKHLRSNLLDKDIEILIGVDNGSEFASGSKAKLDLINQILKPLNARIYNYNPNFDTKKNLIERSHRSDDEEFLIPRGEFINDKKTFLKEAIDYSYYWNNQRIHTGILMNKTPKDKLLESNILFTNKILDFPPFIIENNLFLLRQSTEDLLAFHELKKQINKSKFKLDQKMKLDIFSKYIFLSKNAQKVLTYYQIKKSKA